MICPNCGTQNATGEKICMGCKEELPLVSPAAIRESEKTQEEKTEKTTKAAKKPKNRLKNKKIVKTIIGVFIFALVLVAGIIIYRYKTKNLNANDPVTRLETVVNTFSTDLSEYVKYILPEEIAKNALTVLNQLDGADKKPELLKNFQDMVNNAYESWKDEYGDDLVISLDILNKEKMTDSQLDDIETFYADAYSEYIISENKSYDKLTSDLAGDYSISESKAKKAATALNAIQQYCSTIQVTAGYDLVIRFSLSGRQGSADVLMDVYVIKVDGTWSIDLNSTILKYNANPLLTDAFVIE